MIGIAEKKERLFANFKKRSGDNFLLLYIEMLSEKMNNSYAQQL